VKIAETKKMVGVRMYATQITKAHRNAARAGISFSEYLRRCEVIAGPTVVASSRHVIRTVRDQEQLADE
jgi:hypothetical protein